MENKWEISPEESETTSKRKDVMKEAKIQGIHKRMVRF